MLRSRRIRGRSIQSESPEWQPLLDLAPEHVADFMWMFEVELDRGHRLQAYKHFWSRPYIHLDDEGRAFAYVGDDLYQEDDPYELLDLALCRDREGSTPHDIVRRNIWKGAAELTWARSATKHRISRKRATYVIENSEVFFLQYLPTGGAIDETDARLVFLAEDEEGVELEVIAIKLEEGRLLVIHAMRLRSKYRELYEEAKKWRR